jgi:phosphoenolpyruvate-protein kinase (PTS system EI component)
VEEQAAGYAAVFEAFPGQRVVVRTLDAGSDKPLAFATMPDEENPALGVRGLRVARRDPGLLERQLDAIAEGRPPDRRPAVGDGPDGRHRGRGQDFGSACAPAG